MIWAENPYLVGEQLLGARSHGCHITGDAEPRNQIAACNEYLWVVRPKHTDLICQQRLQLARRPCSITKLAAPMGEVVARAECVRMIRSEHRYLINGQVLVLT